jgi:tetratricopeptide (TPR) repeat protein
MKAGRGLLLALSASIALGACAPAAGGGAASGPAPSGKYAPGTPPKNTKFSNSAQLLLAQAGGTEDSAKAAGLYQQALAQAEQGIAADSTNPVHYFIAGSAYAGLGEFDKANDAWNRAEQIYPAYVEEIDPLRESAWANAFNAGITAYNAGDMQTAVREWTQANVIYNKRPEAYINLAIVQSQEDQTDAAIASYQAALAALDRTPARELSEEEKTERAESRTTVLNGLSQLLVDAERYAEAETILRQYLEQNPNDIAAQVSLGTVLAREGKTAEANAIYDRLLSSTDLDEAQIFNVGVGLFNAKDYTRAAQAFGRVTEMNPHNRDAWYNRVNALYADKKYTEVIPAATRLLEIDPANETAYIILARSYVETKQNAKANDAVRKMESVPVFVDDLQLRTAQGNATLSGNVVGNAARAGTSVTITVTFYGAQGQLGSQSATVNAPAKEQKAPFQVSLPTTGAVTGFSYTVK